MNILMVTKRIFKLFDKEIDLLTSPEDKLSPESEELNSSKVIDGEVSDVIEDW